VIRKAKLLKEIAPSILEGLIILGKWLWKKWKARGKNGRRGRDETEEKKGDAGEDLGQREEGSGEPSEAVRSKEEYH